MLTGTFMWIVSSIFYLFFAKQPFTFAMSANMSLLLSQCLVLHVFTLHVFRYFLNSSLRSLHGCCVFPSWLLIKASKCIFVSGFIAYSSLPLRHGFVEFLNTNILIFSNFWFPNVISIAFVRVLGSRKVRSCRISRKALSYLANFDLSQGRLNTTLGYPMVNADWLAHRGQAQIG